MKSPTPEPAAHDGTPRRRERIAAVVAYMPIVDMRDAVGQVQATPSLGFDPELAPDLSPVDFVSPDDPPTLLVHGASDAIVPIDGRAAGLAGLDDPSLDPDDVTESVRE